MSNVGTATLGPIAETPNACSVLSDSALPGDTPTATTEPSEKPTQEVAEPSGKPIQEAAESSEKPIQEVAEPSEKPTQDEPVAPIASNESQQSAAPKPARLSLSSVDSTLRELKSTRCTKFHIPALVGRPGAGGVSLRTRPVLASCNPQVRKRFTLTIYALLSGQVATIALTAAAVTASILSPKGILPDAIGPHDKLFWIPKFPFDALFVLFPAGCCTAGSFIALSCLRYRRRAARSLHVVCSLFTGILLGLLTYFENYVAMFFLGIVLMSLVVHMFGVCVNLVSCLAKLFGSVTPTASKADMMGPNQGLTGTDKFVCILHDEDAAYTRASLALAGFSWFAATVTAAVIYVEVYEMVGKLVVVPFFFAAVSAGVVILHFTYGVEKQVRRCKPREKEQALINLTIDLFFFVMEVATFNLNFLKCEELGSAQPSPAIKQQSQCAMKQVSSGATQSTATSTLASKSTTPPRVTVAV